jgi:hypothetical protein
LTWRIGASLAFFVMQSGSARSALLQIGSSACGSAGVGNARSNLLMVLSFAVLLSSKATNFALSGDFVPVVYSIFRICLG